ncbi:MAG TPA: CotH kinase family protein [Myxococcota bacterium]|nr:CotH kinase family protein [Myxococcota bacterium]
MLKRFQLLVFATAFFFACSDHSAPCDDSGGIDGVADQSEYNGPYLPKKPYLASFVINKSLNEDAIFQTITGTITPAKIKLIISDGVDATNLIADFEFDGAKVTVDGTTQQSGTTANDFTKPLEYVVHGDDGTTKSYKVEPLFLDELRNAVPHFYITTDKGLPIDSKEVYRSGQLRIDGKGEWEDFEGDMEIRGRGNSTWTMPKKPYRIKLDKAAPLFGLASAKNWVLLANYIDTTHLGNAIALKAGRLLDLPFTHHAIPVEVTVNKEYMGLYLFTEHKEVKEGRIDVGKDGVLLEMDLLFDEPYKFKSEPYDLPVMIQYPELDDMDEDEAEAKFNEIRDDFEELLKLIESDDPDEDYRDRFDERQLAKYLLVYLISSNMEINYPKSTYIYKLSDGIYRMGPIWDFDWAYGYRSAEGKHFVNPNQALFWTHVRRNKGSPFFLRLLESDSLQQLLEKEWDNFRAEHMESLLNYLVNYENLIRPAVVLDHKRWEQGSDDFDSELERILDWMEAREQYITGWIEGLD